ncbi:GTP-binding protein RAD-like [Ptychodera flava]|uniref:GTP-binding protein RAD-like n=1 Tax=Ptychodera flava TaxID=63121 RepID=UPI00396A2A65
MTIKERARSASEPFLSIADLPPYSAPPSYKVYLLGASSVGKSSLTMQFVSAAFSADLSEFDLSLSEDIDDVYDKTLLVDDNEATLQLFDTPSYGQEEFNKNEDRYLADGDAYLLVYSITSRQSFQRANELRFKLRRSKDSENVPIIIVGNKTDLERSREVTYEEGRHFAASFNCKFIETSASLGHNIDTLFEGVVRQIRLRAHKSEEMQTKAKDSPQKRRNSKRRRSSVFKRARGLLGRFFGKRNSDPSPSYRSRSKSCHNLEIL